MGPDGTGQPLTAAGSAEPAQGGRVARARSQPLFSGLGVALLSFFDDAGALVPQASAEHAARLVGAGVAAVLVAGTTGEAASLEPGERLALLSAVRAEVPARTPVIAGTGAASAAQAAALTRAACGNGADAVLALSPPGSEDPRPYYDAVADAAGTTPVLAYHFPGVSAPGLPVEVLGQLPVSGCKDSSGDAARLLHELVTFPGALWVGSAPLAYLAGAMGAAGAILALANVEPERCLAALAGDAGAQLALVEPDILASRRFPAELKALTARRYGTPTPARMG